jgi:transcription termination factor Rho
VLQDGFGFLRSPEANYLPGRMTSMFLPDADPPFSLRTGDTVEGDIYPRPKEGERYFALTEGQHINFEDPEKAATRSISTT